MLDIKIVRNESAAVTANCRNRQIESNIAQLLTIDGQARKLKGEVDDIRKRRNDISYQMKQPLSPEKRQPLITEAKALRSQEADKETQYQALDAQRTQLLCKIPNMTHPDSPIGKDESDNKVLREVGSRRQMEFIAKDHLELMETLELIDFESAAKVTGAKFYYLKNQAVFLELALVQYALSLLQKEGFSVYQTPDLARASILAGTGYTPRDNSTQVYSIENSDLCLIATAEITLGGLLVDSVLVEEELPILMAGFSHCFRTEAGAAGQESKGLYRVHQFSKVEMFALTHPEQSDAMHQRLLAIEERIYTELAIPFRVVEVCTGDLGAPAYRKYDLESWLPGRQKWGEITSVSNCTDYQARRLNIRFKDAKTGKNRFVHMLNGTAIAVSRTLIALIENGQQADGSIRLPPCLGMPDLVPTPHLKYGKLNH